MHFIWTDRNHLSSFLLISDHMRCYTDNDTCVLDVLFNFIHQHFFVLIIKVRIQYSTIQERNIKADGWFAVIKFSDFYRQYPSDI